MNKFLTSLLLAFISGAVLSGWSEPVRVRMNATNYYPGFYVNPTTGHKFIFYSQTTRSDSAFCYSVFDTSDSLVKEACTPQIMAVKDISATGTSDGKDIFVAFSANRTTTSQSCSENDATGCSDIYFTESSDYGKTWTKPRAVPRKNMTDAKTRQTPRILYMGESKRLFIFYVVPGEDEHGIYQVTRPQGSTIFSNEVPVYRNRYPMTKLQVACINSWGENFINVVFEELYWLTLVVSDNNGVSWLPAKGLRFVRPSSTYAMTVSSAGDLLFIASMDRNLLHLMAIDFEQTVENFYVRFEDKLGYRPFAGPVYDENGQVVLSGTMEKKPVSTYIYDTGMKKLKDLDIEAPISPFPGVGIFESEEEYKLIILHNITEDLYMSTWVLEKEGKLTNQQFV
eukprot:TRINITY_DN72646_c0_g1_i1.p1 TRINITY_DN72646_c0_g1~~TRINITY_DN72646_c0_g1_i1.p1  ORF type:complete len:417 (-),score=17.05 TRINITY_DN72646_c0_g1_i1:62-1252(-)